jgi:hypothetical protein
MPMGGGRDIYGGGGGRDTYGGGWRDAYPDHYKAYHQQLDWYDAAYAEYADAAYAEYADAALAEYAERYLDFPDLAWSAHPSEQVLHVCASM